jgi:hypothetical protein
VGIAACEPASASPRGTGLDFIHIYPVVQWLVKKAIETREERALLIRNRALFSFHQHDATPQAQMPPLVLLPLLSFGGHPGA